jgi:subtilisin family serine protease
MRDGEPGLGHLAVAVHQQVEVDRPRTEARAALARPAKRAFDVEQRLEQLSRLEPGLELRSPVQEARLVEKTDGIRLAQRRDLDHSDAVAPVEQLERLRDGVLAVPQVGAETDVRPHGCYFGHALRLGVLLTLALVGPASAAGAPVTHATEQVLAERTGARTVVAESLDGHPFALVELTGGRQAEVALALAGGEPVSRRFGVWRLRAPAAKRVLPALRAAGLVRAAEPDRPVHTLSHISSGDPLVPTEWWIPVIGADRAEPPGPGKPVTVIDSGMDLTHPEFAARAGTEPLNGQVLSAGDGYPHGTAVGSVVAAPVNAVGLVGVYPQAALRSWDADAQGDLTTAGVIAGLDAAIRKGPGVINLSLGVARSDVLEDIVNAAFGTGSLIVAAVGNDRARGSRPSVPAVLPHVLTVAGTDQTGGVASFSSSSSTTDLAAPATDIPVAVPTGFDPTGYSLFDGTSFSSPLVAGTAAWVWTMRPTLENTQVFELMRTSARDIGPPGRDDDTGYGLLDVPAALTNPAPAIDPQEPNDDIHHVRAGGLFRQGTAGLTRPGRGRAALTARLDDTEDPEDVYRVWIPAGRTLVATTRANADVQLAAWGPKTRTVFERGAALRRDLVATSFKRGTAREVVRVRNTTRRGAYMYVDVFLARNVRRATYKLSVTTPR